VAGGLRLRWNSTGCWRGSMRRMSSVGRMNPKGKLRSGLGPLQREFEDLWVVCLGF
jgi:hypothetical protein